MQKRPFRQLFSGAWGLYASRFKVSAVYSLLYGAVPILFVSAAMLFFVFRTTQLGALQTQGAQILMAMAPLLLMGVIMIFATAIMYVAMPINLGRQFNLFSRAWHGFGLTFREAFHAMKKRRLKTIVQNLIFYLYWTAASFVAGILQMVGMAALIPLFAGMPQDNFSVENFMPFFLLFAGVLIAMFVLYAVYAIFYQYSILAGINEGKWYFGAIGRAWELFKKRPGATIGGYCLLFLIKIVAVAIVFLPGLALAIIGPTIGPHMRALGIAIMALPLLVAALFSPLENAFFTMLYYDARVVHEGYRPLVLVEDEVNEEQDTGRTAEGG